MKRRLLNIPNDNYSPHEVGFPLSEPDMKIRTSPTSPTNIVLRRLGDFLMSRIPYRYGMLNYAMLHKLIIVILLRTAARLYRCAAKHHIANLVIYSRKPLTIIKWT
jgi:hypothetical protein